MDAYCVSTIEALRWVDLHFLRVVNFSSKKFEFESYSHLNNTTRKILHLYKTAPSNRHVFLFHISWIWRLSTYLEYLNVEQVSLVGDRVKKKSQKCLLAKRPCSRWWQWENDINLPIWVITQYSNCRHIHIFNISV